MIEAESAAQDISPYSHAYEWVETDGLTCYAAAYAKTILWDW
jgi:hypothetical protein